VGSVIDLRRGRFSGNSSCGKVALGFEEKAFRYDALMFFKRTFDPIHMIAVSIWHPTNDLVIARSRRDEETYPECR
jgi:hypothetical protein